MIIDDVDVGDDGDDDGDGGVGRVNWEKINCCLAAPAKPLLHTICPRFTVLRYERHNLFEIHGLEIFKVSRETISSISTIFITKIGNIAIKTCQNVP